VGDGEQLPIGEMICKSPWEGANTRLVLADFALARRSPTKPAPHPRESSPATPGYKKTLAEEPDSVLRASHESADAPVGTSWEPILPRGPQPQSACRGQVEAGSAVLNGVLQAAARRRLGSHPGLDHGAAGQSVDLRASAARSHRYSQP